MCTGLEPLFLGMGASAATAATLASGAGALLGGTALSMAMSKEPDAPQIPKPEKPPQATKTPDRSTLLTRNAAAAGMGGAFSGNSGTFLTGSGGIAASTLNLGRNVLLGQ